MKLKYKTLLIIFSVLIFANASCTRQKFNIYKLTVCAKCIHEIKQSAKQPGTTTIVIVEAQIDEHFLDVYDLLDKNIVFIRENDILLSDGGKIAEFMN